MKGFDTYETFVPPHMRDGLERYLNKGIEPGGFMRAVLCNDLLGAVQSADIVNRHHLNTILMWLLAYAPSDAWGSPEAYTYWIQRKGAQG